MIYRFDSSGLLDGWARHYPESVFPSLWSRVRSVAQDGRAIAPIVVRDELKKKDDTLLPWCRKAGIAFCDVDLPQQQLLREVLAKFPRLVDTRKEPVGCGPRSDRAGAVSWSGCRYRRETSGYGRQTEDPRRLRCLLCRGHRLLGLCAPRTLDLLEKTSRSGQPVTRLSGAHRGEPTPDRVNCPQPPMETGQTVLGRQRHIECA